MHGQAIGDQEVGADRAVAVLGAHGQSPQPLVGQDLLEDLDRVDRAARLELDFGQEESRPQPIGVGPADPRGGLEAATRPRRACFARRADAGQPREQPELVVARRVGQGNAVDRLGGLRLCAGLLIRLQGQLVAAHRLGGPGQPIVGRRLIRRLGDLVAIAIDQAAVLAEDDQAVALRDDQVAVARDQVASGGPVGLHELDRRLGTQARRWSSTWISLRVGQ